MKKYVIILILFFPTSIYAQNILRPQQFTSDQIIFIGTYQELISLQGEPSLIIENTWVEYTDYDIGQNNSIITRNRHRVDVDLLDYNSGLRYLRIGDSVQLYYINLQRNNSMIHMDEIVINRKTSLKTLTSHFGINYGDRKRMVGSDTFMYSSQKIKSFAVHAMNTYPCDYKFWFVFSNRSNRLIYIEFPLRFDGCIVR